MDPSLCQIIADGAPGGYAIQSGTSCFAVVGQVSIVPDASCDTACPALPSAMCGSSDPSFLSYYIH